MHNKLQEILSKTLEIDINSIDETTSSQTVFNWDSLQHMNILLEIELQMGIRVPIDKVKDSRSYPQLLELIRIL
ncbi:MAG: acyl carrier protein [Oleiphilaceae bacterium]